MYVVAKSDGSRAVGKRGARTERLLASALIAFGIGLRVAQYLGNRSFWGDEVAIALNLRLRTFFQLLHPLSYEQTMPLGLLLVLKAFGSLFGYSEWVLRLPLLLAGCALLPLTWFLYAKLLEPRVALLLVGLLATNSLLIYYSGEVKQYGLDALVTLIVLWLGLNVLTKDAQAWPRLILAGMGAMMFSQPIVFILAGIGAASVWDIRFRTSRTWRNYVVVAGIAWVMMFGLLFWFSYRSTSHSAFMQAFWQPRFIRWGWPVFHQDLVKAAFVLLDREILAIPVAALCALFLAGVVGIARRFGLSVMIMVILPFVLLPFAASLRQYPIVGRLVLFTAPILFWIYAAGLAAVAELLPEKFGNLVFVVLACLFLWPSLAQSWHFRQREGCRDIARKIEDGNHPATIYVAYGHYASWEYYAGDWSTPALLKQRIDLATECLHAAQVRNAMERDQRDPLCVELDFPANGSHPEEIIGVPPGPWRGALADEQWIQQEANRIVRISRTPYVWLFRSDDASHFTEGFPEQRDLFNRLQAELGRKGCRLLERDVEAETRATEMQCSVSTTITP